MNVKKVIIDSAHILILKDKGAYNYDTSTPFLKMVSYIFSFSLKNEYCLFNTVKWPGKGQTEIAANNCSRTYFLPLFMLKMLENKR